MESSYWVANGDSETPAICLVDELLSLHSFHKFQNTLTGFRYNLLAFLFYDCHNS